MDSKLKVLLVDDDHLVRKSIQRHLQICEVIQAEDGAEALEILRSQDVDVVVTDNRMPGLSGLEVLRAAFEIQPQTKRVMHSGNCPADLQRYLDQGVIHRVFPKPDQRPLIGLLEEMGYWRLNGALPRRGRPQTTLLGANAVEAPARPRRSTRPTNEVTRVGAPFVGRRDELDLLAMHCEGNDPPSTLAVVGPRGIGKTQLVVEASRLAAPSIALVVVGADPSGLRRPWYPVLSMIERLIGLSHDPTVEELTDRVLGCGLPRRDLPGLAELFALPGPLSSVELAVRRREAEAAALHLLGRPYGGGGRVVLVFTDLDAFDRPSLALVERLAGMIAGATRRMITTSTDPNLAPALAEVLPLGPLSPMEAWELAGRLSTGEGPLYRETELHRLTSGSPFAVEQLVVCDASGSLPGQPTADGSLKLWSLVRERLLRLPPSTRLALQALALYGTAAPIEILEKTVAGRLADLADRLAELERGGLVSCHAGEVIIRSELVAEVARAETPPSLRLELHAVALDRLLDQGIAPHAVALVAYHAEGAGRLPLAHASCLGAGDDAVRRFDDHGAEIWFRRAIAVCRAMAPDERSSYFVEAAIRLAGVLQYTGRPQQGLGLLLDAAGSNPDQDQQASIARMRGRILLLLGQVDAAGRELRRAIGLLMMGGDKDQLCDCYFDLGRCLAEQGQVEAAIAELREGIDVVTLGEGLGATGLRCERLWLVGVRLVELLLQAGRLEQAESIAAECLGPATRCSSLQAAGRLYALRALAADSRGDPTAAMVLRARAIDELRRLGDRRTVAELLLHNAEAASRCSDTPGERERWLIKTQGAGRVALMLAEEVGWEEGVRRARSLVESC